MVDWECSRIGGTHLPGVKTVGPLYKDREAIRRGANLALGRSRRKGPDS